MKNFFLSSLIILSLITPALALAQAAPKLDYSGFVKCDGVVKKGEEGRQTPCNFAELVNTINKIINWMFYISIPVVAALAAYSGILYMTGVQNNMGTAKKIFVSVGKGFIIMIIAWLAVRTGVGWFVKESSSATTLIDPSSSK